MEKNVEKFYSELAADYDKVRTYTWGIDTFIDEMQRKIIFDFARKVKRDDVLELGCGTGRITAPFAFSNRNSKITAVDISKNMLQQLGKKLKSLKIKNVSLKQGDVTKLPFKNESFDLVYSMRVIWHIKEYEKMISEINRVLKKGGTVVLDFPGKYGHWSILHALFPARTKFKVPVYFFSYREVRSLLRKHGFKIKESRGLHTFLWPTSILGNRIPKLYKWIESFVSLFSFRFSKYMMIKAVKVK